MEIIVLCEFVCNRIWLRSSSGYLEFLRIFLGLLWNCDILRGTLSTKDSTTGSTVDSMVGSMWPRRVGSSRGRCRPEVVRKRTRSCSVEEHREGDQVIQGGACLVYDILVLVSEGTSVILYDWNGEICRKKRNMLVNTSHPPRAFEMR